MKDLSSIFGLAHHQKSYFSPELLIEPVALLCVQILDFVCFAVGIGFMDSGAPRFMSRRSLE
jgi:hypothetical protein